MCLSSDGTLVTEGGFGTLPEHCELVLLGPGQSWRGGESTQFTPTIVTDQKWTKIQIIVNVLNSAADFLYKLTNMTFCAGCSKKNDLTPINARN